MSTNTEMILDVIPLLRVTSVFTVFLGHPVYKTF